MRRYAARAHVALVADQEPSLAGPGRMPSEGQKRSRSAVVPTTGCPLPRLPRDKLPQGGSQRRPACSAVAIWAAMRPASSGCSGGAGEASTGALSADAASTAFLRGPSEAVPERQVLHQG